MAVFRALEHADGHPTAEELYAGLREALPGFALKTVYAILHELNALRLVEPLPLPGERLAGNPILLLMGTWSVILAGAWWTCPSIPRY